MRFGIDARDFIMANKTVSDNSSLEDIEEIQKNNDRSEGQHDSYVQSLSIYEQPDGEVNDCGSFRLLQRKTESFRCLQQVLLSNSSFMRNKEFLFPMLYDPGINDALNYKEPEPIYDDIGQEKYTNLCKELEIVPISRILKSLPMDTMNLKYYGLTNKQMQALTETLKINAYVKNLILQDNWLGRESTEMLCSMLGENSSIRVLNLKECRIGEEGAEKLNEALSTSQFLTELDLSFNSLGDKGLLMLQTGLCEAPNLKVLNISHNNLTEECADTLEKILLENKIIQQLDLSWNLFCTAPGNKKLFNAIKTNDNLQNLNISWNGISLKAAVTPLTQYLTKSVNLQYLDISNNRLEGPSLKTVRRGIFKNQSLISVNIGNNIYNPDEAYFVAGVLPLKQNDPLTHLDMENMIFDKRVLPLLTKIKNAGKTIKFGWILGNYSINGPDINKLIFERCRYLLQKPKKKKLKKDFGYYPETTLPPPPVKKKKGGKKGKKGKNKKKEEPKQETQQEAGVDSEIKNTENATECIITPTTNGLVGENEVTVHDTTDVISPDVMDDSPTGVNFAQEEVVNPVGDPEAVSQAVVEIAD
ncbi:hypothetical protein NQ315_009166 [Exocentrus adspersus]|uniref:Leucine-rich repeat-containing protein n=1 Tax=Exocentrus adspersus TaxID=1586481 RepID=A0AAV8WFX1_9CUCU|nr:hypothetical protein NQ315_009166 [Exocentrus adspersus]